MEDSEPPGIQSETSLEPRCENHLSGMFGDGVGSSRTAQSFPEHAVDAHLLKKMAFRKSLSPGGLNAGGLAVGGLVMKTGSLRPPGDSAGPGPGHEMILNGS
ncbi:hypothetical protein AMELA_G00154570 [Ameiurus melas]|uniref:Uncharacterized protein n=1 Tax=Ameiurus melas TaxID=219545 RepID=A0A7J6AID6_AMEME|nr:hypothetical protein AMELA_G00154570 [Ameiurus melas]